MRLVSLLASATEMIYALGCIDHLVGRSHECDYPPEIQSLPVVSTVQINTNTSSEQIDAQIKQLAQAQLSPQEAALTALSIYAIDIEQLQALQPDVIFTQTQCEVCAVSERDVIKALQQLDMQPRVVSLAPHRLEDVWEDILRVGQALDKREEAEKLVQSYRERLLHLRATTQLLGQRPRVIVLEWLDPLMAAGNWTPELVAFAGGESISGEISIHSPWLSWEQLEAADPDVLILSPCGFTLERTMQDVHLLQQHPAWNALKAVKEGQVYAIDGNTYLNRSGPRLVESAELLGRVIWGEKLGIPVDDKGWRCIQ